MKIKNLLALAITGLMAFGLTGCGGTEESKTSAPAAQTDFIFYLRCSVGRTC